MNGTDIQPRMGSFSVPICRACRPALEAKTKVPAIASRKARPTATVRRHDSPTIQYSRFGSEPLSGPQPAPTSASSSIQKTYTRSIHHTRKSAMTATITYRIHCPTVFGSVWLFTGPSYQVGVQWGWEDRISANTVLPGTMDTPANRAADPKADPLQRSEERRVGKEC